MVESLSYAQSLRVVGQDLNALGVDFFELAKWGDDYIGLARARRVYEKTFSGEGLSFENHPKDFRT
jgi:hypothetical protein